MNEERVHENKPVKEEEFIEGTNESYHPTKTPSTAEHNSVKGNISFESHAKNLLNENITNFDSPKNNARNRELEELRQPKKTANELRF
jgi:hypothetical protein